jgi:hypothetical protein
MTRLAAVYYSTFAPISTSGLYWRIHYCDSGEACVDNRPCRFESDKRIWHKFPASDQLPTLFLWRLKAQRPPDLSPPSSLRIIRSRSLHKAPNLASDETAAIRTDAFCKIHQNPIQSSPFYEWTHRISKSSVQYVTVRIDCFLANENGATYGQTNRKKLFYLIVFSARGAPVRT